MGDSRRTLLCEQAGQWISVRLDCELSELEAARLDRHLASCAACAARAAELTGLVALLRDAPLVAAGREWAPAVPGRRRAPGSRRPAAIAAVMSAAAAVAFVLLGSSAPGPTSRDGLQFRSTSEEVQFVRVRQQRIEPPVEIAVMTPPYMNPRGLL